MTETMIYCTNCRVEMPKMRGEDPPVAKYCLECVESDAIPEKPYAWARKGVDKR